jgi:hypothetical protein
MVAIVIIKGNDGYHYYSDGIIIASSHYICDPGDDNDSYHYEIKI